MIITPLFAAILGLLYVYLSFGVSKIRLSQRISMGTGESNALDRAIRAHGNFSEYVPMTLLLLWFVETLTVSRLLIVILGTALVLGRVLHAVGMLYPKKWLILRQLGILLNYAVIVLLCVYLIYWYYPLAV